jgi:hypothetical protein
MDLGPCRATYDGVDIGGTLGNVTVAFKYEKADIKADQLGTTVLDKRVSGMSVEVTTEFAEVQDYDKFKKAFPNLEIVTNPGPVKSAIFKNRVGISDYDQAALLNLHPLNKPDADLSQDWNFLKAFPSEDSQIVFSPTEQMKLKVIWKIYPEQDSGEYRMFIKGDPANAVVDAVAAAAVPGGGNVGNGTVTGITVNNGYTKTETITLTCVGVPGANQANFDVEGSVTGPLGIATLGVPFIRNEISFTINDGATDFVIGDSFTIATTASNVI